MDPSFRWDDAKIFMQPYKNTKRARLRRALRRGLSQFIQQSFCTVNPGTDYLHNWHIDLIAEHLRACTAGQIRKLIINMPPRAGKSISVSVAWPAWLLGHDPARRVVVASYAQSLSLRHSLDTRLVMQSEWYKQLFPRAQIMSGQNEKSKFMTSECGYRYATSVGGSLTGQGGNFLIVDDPHNPMHVHSKVMRENSINWFEQTFSSRLDDKKRGVFVVVMQRLHEQDLTQHLLDKGGWEHLCLPAEAEAKTFIDFSFVKEFRDKGDLLHIEREGKEELASARRELGSYGFAAQYQQRPVPIQGGLIERSWVKRFANPPAEPKCIVQSWDTAVAAGQQNDYSVCTTWAETEIGYYLLDVLRERVE